MELLIWNMEEKWGAVKRQSKIKSLCFLPSESHLKISGKRGPIWNWKHMYWYIYKHPGLFWLIIRLLLGSQPPQTKIQHHSRTTGRQRGGSLRCAAIYWMLFVLNWCNCSQLQLQHFSFSGDILGKVRLKQNGFSCANVRILWHLSFKLHGRIFPLCNNISALMQQCNGVNAGGLINRAPLAGLFILAAVLHMQAHLGFL